MFENIPSDTRNKINSAMKNSGAITNTTPPKELAGYLCVAHLLGAGGASKFARGNDGRDGNGTSGRSYYQMGYNSISNSVTS